MGKKKKLFTCCVFAVLVLVIGAALYKMDSIYNKLSSLRDYVQTSMESKEMHKEKVSLEGYEVLEDEKDAWYTKYHFIAHAGGGIEGRGYTNSIQAWELSYANDNRVFDADLAFTTDGYLVLRHNWNDNLEQGIDMKNSSRYLNANGMMQYLVSQNAMDYETFMGTKIYYKYDPMSCADMVEFMAEHEDLYVACDMKDDVVDSYGYLVDTAVEMGEEDVLDRIIVNLYDYDLYDLIMDIYDFKNVTMRQHYVSPNNYYELAQFCLTHDIHVVNVSSCYMDDEGVQMLEDYGMHIYVAIADYISDMSSYHELGADGAVTNYLYESDWLYVEGVGNE